MKLVLFLKNIIYMFVLYLELFESYLFVLFSVYFL